MGRPHLRHDLTRSVHGALDDVAHGARVVVAVSGGADSVALLHLVVAARPDLAITVGHVRHGLRADAADAVAARRAAEAVGASFAERQVDVGAGEGPEDAARRARHAALGAIASLVCSDTVLLGHTADDQAETVLLRIARGTGIDGLAGMRQRSRRDGLRLLRPLLHLRRADVRAIAPPGSWVEDPTNVDDQQRRARARHQVLPVLGSLRPDDGDVVPALCRLAALADRDAALLEELASGIELQRYGRALLVPRRLDGVPEGPALHARLLRSAWRLLPGDLPPPPAAVLDRVLLLPPGARLDAPGGVAVTASAQGWALCPDGARPLPRRLLEIDGTVELPEHGLRLRCSRGLAPPGASQGGARDASQDPAHPAAADVQDQRRPDDARRRVRPIDPPPWTLHLPLITGPLRVEGRGPQGARAARRLLQELTPAGLRHLVPLVRDADGRILAVGSRPVDPVPAGRPCLVLQASATGSDRVDVGYPAGP